MSTKSRQVHSIIRQERFKTLDTFGLAGANAQNAFNELQFKTAAQREEDAVRAMLELRGQQNQFDIAGVHEGGQNTRQAALLRAEAERQQAQFGFQGRQNDLNRQAQAQRETDQLASALRLKVMEINAAAAQGDLNRSAQAQREADRLANALQVARMNEGAASGRQAATESGANARNAATIAAENARAEAQRQLELQTRGFRGGISKTNTDLAADHYLQFGDAASALAAIQNDAETLQHNGVDIAAVNAAVIGRLPGAATGTPNLQ